MGQLIDRDHFLRADIDGAGKGGAHEADDPFEAFVNIEKRPRLFAVAPNFNRCRDHPQTRLFCRSPLVPFRARRSKSLPDQKYYEIEQRDTSFRGCDCRRGYSLSLNSFSHPYSLSGFAGYAESSAQLGLSGSS